jgi:hypothetical protein
MRRAACLAAALVVSAGGAGCGYVREDLGAGHAFYQVDTPHFRLTTDVGREVAIARAEELERIWSALAESFAALAPGRPAPTRRLHVVHLASCGDFASVGGNRIQGITGPTRDFEDEPESIACEGLKHRLRVVTHELTHAFNATVFGPLPRWLDEGLAEYFSTIAVEGGQVIVGRPVRDTYADTYRPARLADLVSWGPARFYDDPRAYEGAWRLVHLLESGSGGFRERFHRYLAALAAHTAPPAAWQQAFGDLPAGDLAEAYTYYQRRFPGPRTVPHRAPPPERPEVRRLGTGEAYAVWVEFLMHGLRDPEPLLAELEVAEKQDPGWVGVGFWRAAVGWYYRGRIGGRVDAAALLRRYLAAVPDDARAWHALVTVEMEAIGGSHDPADTTPAAAEGFADDVARLAEVARTATELNTVAWYQALRNRPEVGLGFARRALALDATCANCLDTLAALEFENGDVAQAIEDETRALDALTDAAPDPAMQRRLTRYRARLGSVTPPAEGR